MVPTIGPPDTRINLQRKVILLHGWETPVEVGWTRENSRWTHIVNLEARTEGRELWERGREKSHYQLNCIKKRFKELTISATEKKSLPPFI